VSGSAWEVDDRSTIPCVVCGGEPDRTVELPSLPDVHLGFASSTLCNVCGTAADAGDADVLARRAEAGWPDDPEVVPDMLRLVLTAAGHRPPPKPVAPPEFRQPSPEPLSDADAAVWAELEPLVYDGPEDEVVVRGRIEELRGGDRSVRLVHLAGALARLSDEGGQPCLISDGVTMWRRSEAGMIAAPYDGPAWSGQGSELAHHRSRRDVDLFGFGQPIGPIERTEYLGRPAWRFAFAAPAHKPHDMHVVIDAATGLTLEERFGDAVFARWTAFVTGEPMDPALFRWEGRRPASRRYARRNGASTRPTGHVEPRGSPTTSLTNRCQSQVNRSACLFTAGWPTAASMPHSTADSTGLSPAVRARPPGGDWAGRR
jgi:hypothetical protein